MSHNAHMSRFPTINKLELIFYYVGILVQKIVLGDNKKLIISWRIFSNVPFVCLFPNYWSAVNCYLCSAHRPSPFCGRGQQVNMTTIYKPHFEDSIYAQKAQLIFPTMHKRLETIWYAFIAALKDFYVSPFFSLKLKK